MAMPALAIPVHRSDGDPIEVLKVVADSVFGADVHGSPMDWKLVFGVACWMGAWIRWLRFGYHARFDVKLIYAFGLDLMILHMVQFHGRTGFGYACFLLFMQDIVLVHTFWQRSDVVKSGVFKADSVYWDLHGPFLQTCFIFAGQTTYALFYVYSLVANMDPERSTYLFWFVGYVAVQMTLYFNRGENSQLGKLWDIGLSLDLIWTNAKTPLQFSVSWANGLTSEMFIVSTGSLIMRTIMGFLVNMIFRDIVAFTVPLLLMQFESPLNCVVYSVGVNFILTMDAMNEVTFYVCEKMSEMSEMVPEIGRPGNEIEAERLISV